MSGALDQQRDKLVAQFEALRALLVGLNNARKEAVAELDRMMDDPNGPQRWTRSV